jgi:hypothetical protein
VDFPPVLYGSFLVLGVLTVVAGLRGWQQAGRPQVYVGSLMLIQVAAHSSPVWLRVPGQVLMAVASLWILLRFFRERDRGGLWIGLVFCSMAEIVVVTELFFDDLNWWQASSFAAAAVLLTAILATMAYRLWTMKPKSPRAVS